MPATSGSSHGLAACAEPAVAPFRDGRRDAVAGEDLQEEVRAEPQGLVEDDCSETRDGADCDAEHDPALEVRSRTEPAAQRRRRPTGAHRATRMWTLRLLAHRPGSQVPPCAPVLLGHLACGLRQMAKGIDDPATGTQWE